MSTRLFVLFFFNILFLTNAQDTGETLLSINGEKIASEEFLKIYQKNRALVQDDEKASIDEYLETFIDYKLKVAEARKQGFDKRDAYLKELEGYRQQLVKNYMTDTQASEKLLKEAYNRLKYEINATHILIRVSPEALPADTLYAHQKIHDIFNTASSENFDSIRKKVHDGKDIFGEALGYFSVFRMVYPFESVAYNTKPGNVSEPFRTRFGYHILKVNDRRENRGEAEVAHIMINSSDDPVKREQSHKRILDIHKRLQSGGNFEAMARQFSEDKGTAIKGGKLPKFAAGRLSSKKFEDVAFATNPGEISTPFETKFGWHIIKGIQQFPIGSYSQEKQRLETLLKKDQRSKILTTSFLNTLKDKYRFSVNLNVRDAILSMINNDFYKRQWIYDKTAAVLKEDILQIKDSVWSARSFASWLRQKQFKLRSDFDAIDFKKLFEEFSEELLLQYHEANLESENEEFASILKEYREGLLLFDIMQEEVWDAARTDSSGLREFYNQNKKDYSWKRRVKLLRASYENQQTTQKLRSLMGREVTLEGLQNLAGEIPELKEVIFTSSILEVDDYRLPKGYKASKEWHESKDKGGLVLIRTLETVAPQIKSFEEAKGNVMSDYQNYLEAEWISSLRRSYQVKVDRKELKKLKKKLLAR
ncbi:peptidylprolyl isomerase [Flavobacteriaceae bacterium M23B6Z8]